MKREPAIKIFEVGKSIHFIKNHCKENYNSSNLKSILINFINKFSMYKNKDKAKDASKEEKSFFMNIEIKRIWKKMILIIILISKMMNK